MAEILKENKAPFHKINFDLPKNIPSFVVKDEYKIGEFDENNKEEIREFLDSFPKDAVRKVDLSLIKYFKGLTLVVDETCIALMNVYHNIAGVLNFEFLTQREKTVLLNKLIKNGYDKGEEYLSKVMVPFPTSCLKYIKSTKNKEEDTMKISVNDVASDSDISEMISLIDIERFKKLILFYTRQVSGINPIPDHDIIIEILKKWAIAKWPIYQAFGRKIQIEKNIDMETSPQLMQEMITEMQMKFPQWALNMNDFPVQSYMANKVNQGGRNLRQFCGNIFSTDKKLSTFFSQLQKDSNFDIQLSILLDNRYIKGKSVISIDPFDYITGTYGNSWITCHAPGHECGAGALGYMLDESTIMAFRTYSEDKLYTHDSDKRPIDKRNQFFGSVKLWRQTIHFDKNTCSAIFMRQYPKENPKLEFAEFVREMFEETVSYSVKFENIWDDYGSYLDVVSSVGNFTFDDAKWIASHPGEFSKAENKTHLVLPHNTDINDVKIKIGVLHIPCVKCGKDMSEVYHRLPVCKSCRESR